MNRIIFKKQLSENVFQMRVEAPLIAESCKAGQFIILSLDNEFGERVPLTIADSNQSEGSITLIFQVVGKTSYLLSLMNENDSMMNLVGPLGTPTHIENFGKVVCIGGGIGVAPAYPIAKALKEAGNELKVIIGARNKDLIVYEEEMKALGDEVIICTDDGSYGRKDLVTTPLKELCKNEKPDLVVAIGPPVMMKFCAETTRPFDVLTYVSLNSIMVDGTGMCGSCRVTIGGKTKFVCVDGPEFNGHEVDFDNLTNRLGAYTEKEKHDFDSCRLNPKNREN